MVKFSIALCILFVACAQGAIIDQITAAIKAFFEKVQEERDKLEAGIANAINNAADFQEEIDKAVDDAIAQWEEQLEGVSDNAEHVESCVASSVDFDEVVQDVKSSVEECVDRRLKTLQTDYEATKTAFDDFKDELNNVQASAAECSLSSGILNYLWCLEQVWEKTNGETTESWFALLQQASALTVDFIAFENALVICGWTDGLKTLENEREAAYKEVRECVAELEAAE